MQQRNAAEEHTKTLNKLHGSVETTLDQISLSTKATDKAALANALKILLECRRIEEMMQTRSTIQQVLERMSTTGTDGTGAEILTEADIAASMEASFGDMGERKESDVLDPTETETLTENEEENG